MSVCSKIHIAKSFWGERLSGGEFFLELVFSYSFMTTTCSNKKRTLRFTYTFSYFNKLDYLLNNKGYISVRQQELSKSTC